MVNQYLLTFQKNHISINILYNHDKLKLIH